jgi:hypothetical protein
MYGFPLSAAVLVGVGIENITSPLSALAFAGAVLCVATFLGLRTGREWARLLGGCVATALFAGGVIVIVQSFPLTELAFQPVWRVAVSGAHCAIGVRSTHYESEDFGQKLSVDVANGIITEPDLIEVSMYSAQTDNPEHVNDKYLIVQCRVA